MTPQELKNSVLQLAIQGKLVEQHSEEGTGEELFQQIQVEKQVLIAAGVFKKDKPLPEIAEDEIPFDIPNTWEWVRLDDVVTKPIKRGKSPTYTAKSGTLVFAQKCNTKAGFIDLDIALYLDESKLDKYPDEEFMQDKDIVINSTGNGTLGRVGVYRDTDNPRNLPIVPDSHVTVIRANGSISVDYVYYVLKHYQPFMEKLGTGSTNQTELSANVVRALLFPLPPLVEQKRIVAKIEELLPLIDRYEQAWSRLEDFNKRFPVDMQKSILQMAIQGKLVHQLPEEGTGDELFRRIQAEKQALIKSGKIKKEKPLPEIPEDEIPFEIPESWKWVHIGELFQHNTGKALNSSNKDGRPLEYITTSNVYWNRFEISKLKTMLFTDAEIEKCTVQKGDLLVLEGGDIGRAAIWNYEFAMRIQNHIHRLRSYGDVCIEFFYHIFFLYKSTGLINGKGIGIKGLSANMLHSLIVPLPPLAEQKRIVAKLEELLPLCERLK